jgi:Uma2 family endonuclease
VATGQPVWALAERFPRQGHWTELEFFALPEGYPRVELSNGHLEVLPLPTDKHQAVLTAVLLLLLGYAKKIGAWVRPAGIHVRLREGQLRGPDVAFLTKKNAALRGNKFWSGADLVVEVVSEGAEARARDYVEKREEYAKAGIPEYWIVDPEDGLITVLRLEGEAYVEHGVSRRGDTATSATFDGLSCSATDILDAD